MNTQKPKTLLRFLMGAAVAFRRGRLTTFVLGPILLEPFVTPIFQAFREEHKRFMQENFPENLDNKPHENAKAESSGQELLH